MAFIRNANAAISCGTVAQGQNVTIRNASIILVDDTRDDLLLWTGTIQSPRTLVTSDPITIPTNDLVVEFPAGDVQNAAVKQALDDLISNYNTNFTILLGTGDMGNAGTSSQPAGSTGYVAATNVTLQTALT